MMNVNINGVEFKNPIIAASGTFGFGEEFSNFYDVGKLGGISSKGLTINPKEGNDGLRVVETASGMMNSVGLNNPGIDAFIVSDPFIISYIKKNYPQVEVHLSTQNSTSNYKTIEYFKNEGIDRVVLAREVHLEDMREMIKKTGVDIEVFIDPIPNPP